MTALWIFALFILAYLVWSDRRLAEEQKYRAEQQRVHLNRPRDARGRFTKKEPRNEQSI